MEPLSNEPSPLTPAQSPVVPAVEMPTVDILAPMPSAAVPEAPTPAAAPISTAAPHYHAIPLRTLSTDMAEAVREGQGSIIKIAIAEEERLAAEKENASPRSKKNVFYIAAGATLMTVALVGAGVALWYKVKSDRTVAVVTTPVAASIVESEATDSISITGKTSNEIANNFQQIVADPANSAGTIKNVLVTEGSGTGEARVPANQFLSALGAHVTTDFSKALSQDYMLGMYTYDKTNPFLMLTGVAHDSLLTGMTAWEPYMLQNLAPLLGIDMTGAAQNYVNAPFADTLIENHATRAIVDSTGKPIIFYSFLDPDDIFIGTDPGTLAEAVLRLHQ